VARRDEQLREGEAALLAQRHLNEQRVRGLEERLNDMNDEATAVCGGSTPRSRQCCAKRSFTRTGS